MLQQGGHGAGVDDVLLREHACGQGLGRVVGQHGHHGLVQDGAHVQLGRHAMHGAAGKLAAGIDGPLVGVQAGEGRQQRGVDVDHAAGEMLHEAGRQDAHEAGQHHHGGLVGVDALRQRGVEVLAAGKLPVIQHLGGNPLFPGKDQALRVGLVADHGGHAGAITAFPILLLGRLHNGSHIGPAARDQNHDVFHCAAIIPAMTFDHQNLPLSPTEARVLATLMEKARTVPDSYPLTLNSLASGCNQKTSREPVMQLSDAEILATLDALRDRHLVIEVSGQRAMRWEHNFERVLGVPSQASALLGLLMLRGPQTAAELRTNAERWHRFADTGSVEAFLEELQDRSADKGGALVQLLPKAPGAREARWAHLLCGAPVLPLPSTSASGSGSSATALTGAEAQRLEALEARVAALEAQVQRLCAALGDSV